MIYIKHESGYSGHTGDSKMKILQKLETINRKRLYLPRNSN